MPDRWDRQSRWKHAVLLALLLAALTGALSYRELRAPTVRVSLQDLLCQAGPGPILAPNGSLGDFNASTFLGKAWGPIVKRPFRVAYGPADVLFSQTQVVPLQVDLEGRCLRDPNPHPITISLNAHSPRPFTLERDWKHLLLQLPASDLIEGLNRLSINSQGNVPTQWRNCELSPLHADARARSALSGPDRLCLYYGAAKEFSVVLLPSTYLTIKDLKPWDEPEAPPGKDWELTVRVQSGQAQLDKTWHLTGQGPKKLALPVDVPTLVCLSLMATAFDDPLFGQSGLCLLQPRLDSWSTPLPSASQTPADTPRRPPQGGTPPSAAPPVSSVSPLPSPSRASPAPGTTSRPNIVLYLIDTLRADHLHCYGYTNDTSPHLDALARDGVLFEDCMSAASWTKPASASIQTGLIAHHHRAEDFPDKLVLTGKRKTLAEWLSGAGYATRGLVSNPFVSSWFGFDKGFQTYGLMKSKSPELVEKVKPWLEAQSSKRPFYLYLHTIEPHMPYHAPKRFLPPNFPQKEISQTETFALLHDWRKNHDDPDAQRRLQQAKTLYDGSIAGTDEGFGQLVSILKRRGLYDNTIIVVVSDHGEEFFDHGALGHMSTLYQELMHVPLIIKFPNNLAAGTVVKTTWQGIDVAPTLLRAAGLPVPDSMEGIPYVPGSVPLKGDTGPPPSVPLKGDTGSSVQPAGGETDRPAYISVTAGAMAELFGQGKALRRTKLDGIRVGRWVLYRAYCSHVSVLEPIEVYDLKTDPKELHNLAYSRPELRAWLYSVLNAQDCHSHAVLGAVPSASPEEVDNAVKGLQYGR